MAVTVASTDAEQTLLFTSLSNPTSTGTRSFTYDADGNTTAITGLGSNRGGVRELVEIL